MPNVLVEVKGANAYEGAKEETVGAGAKEEAVVASGDVLGTVEADVNGAAEAGVAEAGVADVGDADVGDADAEVAAKE